MNREILFKGWCPRNEKWIEGDVVFQNKNTVIRRRSDAMCFEVDPSTVCQYTGFTDEHHKKIFEGDIVGFIDGMSTENGFAEYEQVGLVEWYGSVGAFNVTERLSAESWEVLEDCVVLGNRWDNPELLEG